jgi:hypothetical protein
MMIALLDSGAFFSYIYIILREGVKVAWEVHILYGRVRIPNTLLGRYLFRRVSGRYLFRGTEVIELILSYLNV